MNSIKLYDMHLLVTQIFSHDAPVEKLERFSVKSQILFLP